MQPNRLDRTHSPGRLTSILGPYVPRPIPPTKIITTVAPSSTTGHPTSTRPNPSPARTRVPSPPMTVRHQAATAVTPTNTMNNASTVNNSNNDTQHPGRTRVCTDTGALLVPSLHNWERPAASALSALPATLPRVPPPGAAGTRPPGCCEGRVVRGPVPTGQVLSCCVVDPKLASVDQTVQLLEARALSAQQEIEKRAGKAREEVAAVFQLEVQAIEQRLRAAEQEREERVRRRFWGAATDVAEARVNTIIRGLPDTGKRSDTGAVENKPASRAEFATFKIPTKLSNASKPITSDQKIRNFQNLQDVAQAQLRTLEEALMIHNGTVDSQRSRICGEESVYEPDIPNLSDVRFVTTVNPDPQYTNRNRSIKVVQRSSNEPQTELATSAALVSSEELELPNYSKYLLQKKQPVSYEQLLSIMEEAGSAPLPRQSIVKESSRQLQTVSFYTPEVPVAQSRTIDQVESSAPVRPSPPARAIMIYEPTEDYLIEDLSSRNNTSKPSLFVSASNFLKTEPPEVQNDHMHMKDWPLGKSTHFTSESLSKVALKTSEHDLRARIHEDNLERSSPLVGPASSRGGKRATFAPSESTPKVAEPPRASAPVKKITPIYLYRRHTKKADPWRIHLLNDLLSANN